MPGLGALEMCFRHPAPGRLPHQRRRHHSAGDLRHHADHRFQILWTQPLWVVLHILPFAAIATPTRIPLPSGPTKVDMALRLT